MQRPTDKQVRQSVLVITVGCALLYFIMNWRLAAVMAVFTGISGLFIPPLARWITEGWLAWARILGWINTRIILTIVFFLVLTPLALLRRLFQRSPMRTLDRSAASHWTVREHTFSSADLEKPW